ncbi:MAG TPA: hypothetical protein VEW74_01260 [Candidatus Nitrosotalea sp.]|nr:hypothetical protein [Candidatus Nitrosotalea sp.]
MSASPLRRRALPALILLAGLAGCAGSTTTGAYVPAAAAESRSVALPHDAPASGPMAKTAPTHWLYVSDYAAGAVKILKNGSYREIGSITSGIANPDGIYLDKRGNLYVVNQSGPNITEYAPKSTVPSHAYANNMLTPNSVTTDAYGNVFEADFGSGSGGAVNEYYQGLDQAVRTCSPGSTAGGNAGVFGVAVDPNGDVFVAYALPGSNGGAISEYPGGLKGCPEQTLAISFGLPTGIALDAAGDLVVPDAIGHAVDVVAPPYTSVSRTIGSGFTTPWEVTLSKDNNEAFVADRNGETVTIVNYTTGANLKVLDSRNGLFTPLGAVDSPNAVY